MRLITLHCQDASEYTCEVDIMARPISITHRLEVLVAPRVQCKDSQVTLRKGESYTLRCSAQGQPNPRVSWSRRSGPASWPAQSGLSLHLARVDRTTEGEYVCTAANGVGQPAVASVSVSVLCKYIRLSVRTSPHLTSLSLQTLRRSGSTSSSATTTWSTRLLSRLTALSTVIQPHR